jgi:putative intracellular protease/amidase
MAKRILMVLTNHADMDNTESKTGVWLGEFTHPYYAFKDAGYEVTLASPLGGEPPIDPTSKLTEHITSHNRRFNDDEEAQNRFKNTVKLQDVSAQSFDGLFYPGGHGPMWDLASSQPNADLVMGFINANKPVAAVCHGPAALVKAAEQNPSLLRGKRVVCFTDTEETMVMKKGNIPFSLEHRLQEVGGDFHHAGIPFTSHIEEAGLIITGQNPASAGPCADALIRALGGAPK